MGGGHGFFLAFDAITVGSERVWHLALDERLAALSALGLCDAETYAPLCQASKDLKALAAEKVAAAGNAAAAAVAQAAPPQAPAKPSYRRLTQQPVVSDPVLCLNKKQQAPPAGKDSITVLLKAHHSVSLASLQALEASLGACPYPTDGLVFTPKEMLYALGMPQLLMKWQPQSQVGADIAGHQLAQATPCPLKLVQQLEPALVYECLPASLGRGWVPVSVRWDKHQGNAGATLARILSSQATQGKQLWHDIDRLCEVVAKAQREAGALSFEQRDNGALPGPHQARLLPFTELHQLVSFT